MLPALRRACALPNRPRKKHRIAFLQTLLSKRRKKALTLTLRKALDFGV